MIKESTTLVDANVAIDKLVEYLGQGGLVVPRRWLQLQTKIHGATKETWPDVRKGLIPLATDAAIKAAKRQAKDGFKKNTKADVIGD